MSCSEPPQPGTSLDDKGDHGLARLIWSAGVPGKLGPYVGQKNARSEFTRIDDLNAEDSVLIGTGMNRCMLSADLLTTSEVAAKDIYECGVLVEQLREGVDVVHVPRTSKARDKLLDDFRLTHFRR